MSRDLTRAATGPSALPSYAHPPLVQVRMGVRVDEPLVLDATALTEQLGPAWISVRPPLAADGVATIPGSSEILLFRSILGDQRLDAHIRGMDFLWDGRGGETYPHYESLRDAFLLAYDAWTRSATVTAIVPDHWQIAYRNRFPRGTVWQRLDDLRFCRLLETAGAVPLAGRLRDLSQRWDYQVESLRARLRCEVWLEGATDAAAEDALWLELTCESDDESEPDPDWLAAFDAGRRQIVAMFREMMSPEANAYWGVLRG